MNVANVLPDLLSSFASLLAEVESRVCDIGAYGCKIEDAEHPWHSAVMDARKVLEDAEDRACRQYVGMVRRDTFDGREYVLTSELTCDEEDARRLANESDAKIPGWANANPQCRPVRVRLIEITG